MRHLGEAVMLGRPKPRPRSAFGVGLARRLSDGHGSLSASCPMMRRAVFGG